MPEMDSPNMPPEPTAPVPPHQPPPAAPPAQPRQQAIQAPKPHGAGRKVLTYIALLVFLGLVVAVIYLGVIVAALTAPGIVSSVARNGADDQVVAVYAVNGIINAGTAATFDGFYRAVRDDKNVKAVVLRVNSPGGGVSSSDQIHNMVQILRDKGKKVVVSMGGVAASGGYYISAPADLIYAESTTITASIGVIMPLPIVKDFLDKHGVNMLMIRSTQSQRWKAAINYFETPDPETLRARQGLLDTMHAKFEQVVRQGRGERLKARQVKVTVTDLDGKEVVREQTYPLNGQVLMAEAAKEVGLVDRIGYLAAAQEAAASLAGLTDPKILRYSKAKTMFERAGFPNVSSGIDASTVEKYLTPRMLMLWQGQ